MLIVYFTFILSLGVVSDNQTASCYEDNLELASMSICSGLKLFISDLIKEKPSQVLGKKHDGSNDLWLDYESNYDIESFRTSKIMMPSKKNKTSKSRNVHFKKNETSRKGYDALVSQIESCLGEKIKVGETSGESFAYGYFYPNKFTQVTVMWSQSGKEIEISIAVDLHSNQTSGE